MEVAKITSKGQITIPISIRRKLGINEGDKVLFMYKADGVLMVNPNTFQGVAADVAEEEILSETSVKEKKAIKPAPDTVEEAPVATAAVPPAAELEPVVITADVPVHEVVQRPAPPPAEEEKYKPDTHVGGLDLSSILDDIRSIGSNI